MSFKQIIGQDKPIAILQNALATDRLAHAYLFYGPSGIGKNFTALNFAKAVNCLNRLPGGVDCCDECAGCKKISAANHIDVSWIKLPKGKSAISIEQIRQMQSQISLRPYEAKYKIFCVQDADFMSEEAQSCLLKTLEEPPVKSIIILTASNVEALLGTIASRCQAVKFYSLSLKDGKDILTGHLNIDDKSAYFLSHITQSGFIEPSDYSGIDVLKEKNKIIDEFTGFLDNPGVELYFLNESSEKILWILSVLLWWYRDILIYKETLKIDMLANKDRIKDLSLSALTYGSSGLGRIITVILNAAQLLSESNVNSKLALTVMAADILNSKNSEA